MTFKTVDVYIRSLSKEDKIIAEEMRKIIHSVSHFEETIAWNMPTFKYDGKMVAGFRIHKNHIGFYPYSGSVIKNFSVELKDFKTSIGAVQFPKGKKLPKTLIKKIIKARMKDIDSNFKR
jgi:uncharacterized protein YdhG (YjbR/CyaY superfamily)